jgi:hypothetical protein
MDLDEDVPMSGVFTPISSLGQTTVNPIQQTLSSSILAPASLTNAMVSPALLDRDMSPSPDSDDNDSSHEQTSSMASTVQSANPEESLVPLKVSKFIGVVIPPPPAAPALPIASSQSGVVYDPRMRFHTEKELEDDEEIHPEDPRRIWEIFNELKNAGLVAEDGVEIDKQLVPFKLHRISARFADQAEICLVHSQRHFEWMAGLAGKYCTFKILALVLNKLQNGPMKDW